MSLPIFAYNNIMTTGTVTSTSEDTLFPVSNLANWNPSKMWKAAAVGTVYVNVDAGALVDVDYFAVHVHNLTEKSATVKLQWSNDGSTGWTDLTTTQQKSLSEVIFVTFTSVNKRYFRVEVAAPTAICSIGVIAIGEYLTMERGVQAPFTPPHADTKNEQLVNVTRGGIPCGNRVIQRGGNINANFSTLSTSWVRTNIEPLITHSEQNPLFFAWNHDTYPNEAVFIMLDTQKSKISYKDTMYMQWKASGMAWHKLAEAPS